MADDVRSASRALARGSAQEALVHLWNAVEPARLAGDAGRLRAIAGLAQRIRAHGDEGEAREAERLLETVRTAVSDDGSLAPATGRLDAEVYASGQPAEELQPDEAEDAGRGVRIGNLVWIALVVAIILFNILGGRGGG